MILYKQKGGFTMWRLGYRVSRKKDPSKMYWEYTYVAGELDSVYARINELSESLGSTKFSIELREKGE